MNGPSRLFTCLQVSRFRDLLALLYRNFYQIWCRKIVKNIHFKQNYKYCAALTDFAEHCLSSGIHYYSVSLHNGGLLLNWTKSQDVLVEVSKSELSGVSKEIQNDLNSSAHKSKILKTIFMKVWLLILRAHCSISVSRFGFSHETTYKLKTLKKTQVPNSHLYQSCTYLEHQYQGF